MSGTDSVTMENIVKQFGDLTALDHVGFQLVRGEVNALLGENGAGKTTLVNVLFGLCRANEGEILIDGQRLTIADPCDALQNGIAIVHQHFKLISNFTAMENILLGTGSGLKFDEEAQRAKVALSLCR